MAASHVARLATEMGPGTEGHPISLMASIMPKLMPQGSNAQSVLVLANRALARLKNCHVQSSRGMIGQDFDKFPVLQMGLNIKTRQRDHAEFPGNARTTGQSACGPIPQADCNR